MATYLPVLAMNSKGRKHVRTVLRRIGPFPSGAQPLLRLDQGEDASLGAFVVMVRWNEEQFERGPETCLYDSIGRELIRNPVRFSPRLPYHL